MKKNLQIILFISLNILLGQTFLAMSKKHKISFEEKMPQRLNTTPQLDFSTIKKHISQHNHAQQQNYQLHLKGLRKKASFKLAQKTPLTGEKLDTIIESPR